MRERRMAVLAGTSIILAFAIVMFVDVIFGMSGKIAVFAGDEFVTLTLPRMIFGFSELRSGNLPLWNPYVSCGGPFFAYIETALLYPPNWLNVILPIAMAINLGLVLHVFLGGYFMYLWARTRRIREEASILAGMIFMFSAPAFLYACAGSFSNLYTLVWAPLVFMTVDKLFEKGTSALWPFAGIAAVSMQVLAGHAQYLFYTGLAALIYSGFLLVERRPERRVLIRGVLCSFAVYGGAVALTAVQFIPAVRLALESARGTRLSLDFAGLFSFPPENLITLIAPVFFGDDIRGIYWGRWFFREVCVFTGIGGLSLAVCGAVFSGRRERITCLGMVVISTVLSLGAYTPVFRVLYDMVPGFALFRGTSKFMFLTSMFLAMLAAYGAEWLLAGKRIGVDLRRGSRQIAALLFTGSIITMAMVFIIGRPLTGEITPWWRSLILSLPVVERKAFFMEGAASVDMIKSISFISWVSAAAASVTMLIFSVMYFLAPKKRYFRHMIVVTSVLEICLFAASQRTASVMPDIAMDEDCRLFFDAHTGDYRIFKMRDNNMAMVYRKYFIWGKIPSRRYAEFMFFTQGLPPDEAHGFLQITSYNKLYNMLRCGYLMLPKDLMRRNEQSIMEGERYHIYRAHNDLPHAFLVHDIRVIKGRDNILLAMSDAGFDPSEQVILEDVPRHILPADMPEGEEGFPAIKRETEKEEAVVRIIDTDTLEIDCTSSRLAVLVVTDSYGRDWRVTDISGGGKRYEILPANYILMGIPVGEGEHHIRMEYLPRGFVVGQAVTAVSVISLIAGIVAIAAISRKRYG